MSVVWWRNSNAWRPKGKSALFKNVWSVTKIQIQINFSTQRIMEKWKTLWHTCDEFRCEIYGFCLLPFCQNERTYLCSVCILFEESVFIFQFLNYKLYNYVKQNCKFHHSKILEIKTLSTNWANVSSLNLTEWEETKNRYFAPWLKVNWFIAD